MTLTSDSPAQSASPKSPKSPESEKSKRYDRQLRLWGDHGQNFLESAQVCLINATATGTEILKSLVLPGVGSFTIVDGTIASVEDVGNNFFLTKESIGKSRGKAAAELLKELNPEVKGEYLDEHVENLLEQNGKFFSSFSVVIAAGIHNERMLNKLSEILWELGVPLVVCNCIGFVGFIRIQLKEHTVVESHPDNTFEDLRLDCPFSSLQEYFDQYSNFDELTRKEIVQLPYVVILNKYLVEWRKENGKTPNILPETYVEKEALRTMMKKAMEIFKQGKSEDESTKELDLENFEEAIKAVNKVLRSSFKIPFEVEQIINDSACSGKPQSTFWILVRGLRDFINANNCLPLRGSIPDMSSDSNRYIQLQKIYSAKAKEDVESLLSFVQSSGNTGKLLDKISENEVKLFCKNVRNLKVVRSSLIKTELSGEPLKELVNNLSGDGSLSGNDELAFYLILKASDRFYSLYNHFPGQYDNQIENDIVQLKSTVKDILNDLGSTMSKDDLIHEICRYGGSEIHSIAAFIGGCAAQEVVKLITKQYVPLNNTLIYNGIASSTVTYTL